MAEIFYYPIYAKENKDVPEWMRSSHEWHSAVAVDKLPKYQLKVKLCCQKCEEKVIENIRELPGVFDVRAERFHSKVVVVAASPSGVDEHEVLRKARKIDRKAKFVELDAKEKSKKGDDDKKEEEKKKKEEEKKKKKEKEEAEKRLKELESIYSFKPYMQWGPSPYSYYMPSPVAYLSDDKKEDKKKEKEEKEREKEKKIREADFLYTFRPYRQWGASPSSYYSPSPVAYMSDEYRPSQSYAPRYHYPPLPGHPEDGHMRQYVYYY